MCDLSSINRATKKGFIAYMAANPVCFRQQFDLTPTPDNIAKGYREAMRLRKQSPAFAHGDRETSFVCHRPYKRGDHS